MSATGISKEIETAGQLEELRQEVRIAAEELLSAANMKPGQILVVGCSSSEIASHKIGSYSSAEIGKAVFEELYAVTKSQGLYLAAQCCEHLNRALIVEEEAAEKYGLDAYGTAWRKGEWSMGENAEKEAAISTVCASGVDLDADSISWMKREVSASYTVEASFVMTVAFFFIAALLNGGFEVHGRITGRFVLQEAMERCLYREDHL